MSQVAELPIPQECNQPTRLTGNKTIVPLERLIILRRKGLTFQEIGDIVGISKVGVYQRLKAYDEDIHGAEEFNKDKAYYFTLLQRQLLRSLTPDELKKLSAHQKVWSLGVITDKCLTLEGKSNLNIDIRSMIQHTSQDLDAARKALSLVSSSTIIDNNE